MADYIPEKLRVFVSSTITECIAERKTAKQAIESLNHEPILFEHIGARSTPPRELYLRKLDESHIFIGIYRKSYGWIGPGATISGIEDEYRRSSQRGMPRLVYILEENDGRDQRLVHMLRAIEAEAEITFSKFRIAEELYKRIREDIEAEIAKRFHETAKLEAIVHIDAATTISGLIPTPNSILHRNDVGEQLLKQLATENVIQVTGELGIGKTVFLASLAKDYGFLFVSGTQLSNHELASVLANKLAALGGRESRYFIDAPSAYSALQKAWQTAGRFTLVIDDCQTPEFIAAVLKNVGDANGEKKLIYSIRDSNPTYGHRLFRIPPLSRAEVEIFLKLRGLDLSFQEIDSIYHKSAGNPLYLLYFSQTPDTNIEQTLSEYEMAAWRSLRPLARELASYLAIADQRIAFAELLALAGRGAGEAEDVAEALQGAQVFITELPSGYALRHEHQRTSMLSQLLVNPSKFAYYSNRVAKLLKNRGDYIRAFFVLFQTDKTAANQIARFALFDAQRRHDFRSQLRIIDNILENNRPPEVDDLMVLLLSKIQALHHTDGSSQVDSVLIEVDALAANSKDIVLKLRAREARTAFLASTTMTQRSLQDLQQLEQEYLNAGDKWSAGRLTGDLSSLFIATRRFPESFAASERGLRIFEELQDEYGISISLRNMAIASSEMPGKEAEATRLFEEIRERQNKVGTPRERAWLCNYMVRTLRRKRQFPEALQYGREAIRIGEMLGDLQLIGVNRISLGNVYRDMADLKAALAEYEAGAECSRKYGDRNLESHATRLAAAIHRRQGNKRLALEHALSSVNLVDGTFAFSALASALEELGDCYSEMREWPSTARSYAKAAATTEDGEEQSRLIANTLAVCVYKGLGPDQYIDCLNIALRQSASSVDSITQQAFDRIKEMLESAHLKHAILLFGIHFRMLFEGLPPQVARFLFRRALNQILTQIKGTDTWRLLFPVIPLLLSVSNAELTLPELTHLGDLVSDRIDGLHFKPKNEGASWVLALNLRSSVILTIACLDGRTDTFTAAALLAFFFKGFERNIAQVLSGPDILRQELDIYIGNIQSMPADLREHFPKDINTCVVTRPASHGKEYLPTFVVCQEGLDKKWQAGTGSGAAVQILLAQVLIETAFQLLKGKVDMDVLEPKIFEVVRKTVS